MSTVGTVIIRPVKIGDGAAIWDLLAPNSAETVGMTSLPRTLGAAEAQVAQSSETLADLATGSFRPADGDARRLLFVAVDTSEPDEVIGLTGIVFKIGLPNFAVLVTTNSQGQGLIMHASSKIWTRSELGSTFLGPAGRGRGLGTMLSRGRFMFLHLVRHQIPTSVVSHLRGRFNDDGTAPFWDCFGAEFAPQWLTSVEAERALEADPGHLDEFVDTIVPLTAPVLESLGQVNKASVPAYHLLTSEGLYPNGMYDPIDGGPTIEGDLDQLATARARIRGRAVLDRPGTTDALIAAAAIDQFWVTRGAIDRIGPNEIGLASDLAHNLKVTPGTLLSAAPLAEEISTTAPVAAQTTPQQP